MGFDDPEKANLPYELVDVEEIERIRGRSYPRLRATVEERDFIKSILSGLNTEAQQALENQRLRQENMLLTQKIAHLLLKLERAVAVVTR